MADIAVIIVNYGTAELALAALDSVLRHGHGGRSVEVHLVDNASPRDDAAIIADALRARGPETRVTFYPERENHGFGRGNNIVLERLAKRPDPPRYVFLLNPDAQLQNEAIAILVNFLEAHPKAAIAGTHSQRSDGGEPASSAFRFPGLISTFSSALNFGPITRPLSRYTVALPPGIATQRVDWVSGAAVLARFEVLRDLGFFDPTYFLYFEEVDLMLKAARRGWECWHVAEARIVHYEGASTGVRSAERRRRYPGYVYRSWQHYHQKNNGRAYALLAGILWMAGAAGNHLICKFVPGRQPAAPLFFFRDFLAFAMRPLIGLPARPD